MDKEIYQNNHFENSKNDKGQDFTNTNIETQNNFYSQIIFKSLNLKSFIVHPIIPIKNMLPFFKSLKINNTKSFIVHPIIPIKNMLPFFTAIFLFVIIFLVWIIQDTNTATTIAPLNMFSSFKIAFYATIPLFVISIFILFSSKNFIKYEFILKNDCVVLKTSKNKEKSIRYNEIRSILKSKDLSGYCIYIYKDNQVYPYIQFNIDYTETIHQVNAIYELVINKINESTEQPQKRKLLNKC